MSKLSPIKSSPNEVSQVKNVFVAVIRTGKDIRVPVLDLDDQIRTLDSCGHYKWITLRDYFAASNSSCSCSDKQKSPIERFISVMGNIEHRIVDGKAQYCVKAKVGTAEDLEWDFTVQELRVSPDLLQFLREQEASYLPPLIPQVLEAYNVYMGIAAINLVTNNKFQEAYNNFLQKIGKDRAGSRTSIFRNPFR